MTADRLALLEEVARAARALVREAEGAEMTFGFHKYVHVVLAALDKLDASAPGEAAHWAGPLCPCCGSQALPLSDAEKDEP